MVGKKSKEDYVKLNVDSAFNSITETRGCSAIIRDDHGFFIAASNCSLPYVADAATVEALALRDGLFLAGNIGCNRVVVNSDCQEVIDVMKNGGNFFGPAAAIYDNCFFQCLGFSDIVFEHCPREANLAAHVLASKVDGPLTNVWKEVPVITNHVAIFSNE